MSWNVPLVFGLLLCVELLKLKKFSNILMTGIAQSIELEGLKLKQVQHYSPVLMYYYIFH